MQKICSFSVVFLLTSACEAVSGYTYYVRGYPSYAMDWNHAQHFCRKHHTDLASIVTAQEASEIPHHLRHHTIWIGLYRTSKTEDWRWSEGGSPLEYFWGEGQPKPGHENCVATTNGKWYSHRCHDHRPFLCFKSHELVLVRKNKTWEEALTHCRHYYTDLVSLLSLKEFLRAQSKIATAQTAQVWTGLRYLAGQWLWVNGQNLEHQAWYGGEKPQCPAIPMHCGTLPKQGDHWGMWDCSDTMNFLCYIE